MGSCIPSDPILLYPITEDNKIAAQKGGLNKLANSSERSPHGFISMPPLIS